MMSSFWHWWIIGLTLICTLAVVLLLAVIWKKQPKDMTDKTTGHEYDSIKELDNPMPQWWCVLFVATLVFSVGYLALYPGLGYWKGLLGWTSTNELERNQTQYHRRFAPEFARYGKIPVEELIHNPKAMKMGRRIFANNCAQCHGMDAGGSFGFPDLTDGSWLYGGTPEAIEETLIYGRQGQMPAWEAILGNRDINNVTHYVRELSGLNTDASQTERDHGKKIYQQVCMACHDQNGTGNTLLGAPNLTDNKWLYGSSHAQIAYTLRKGRNGVMPAWKDFLGKDRVHLVAAYVYSLSHEKEDTKK
ncbi:Cbb3-type cytochrome c oxidase subunit CcoP2 [invertebrate metagenome]|uniref:Cytochrome c oxidase subunit III n=1 Tax=invertebrate metagenome TaxID=1711999 RepID=A0A2H9TA96_9ZZZZ